MNPLPKSERLKGERWKWVVGFEGSYKISSFGRVFSVKRKRNSSGKFQEIPGRLMKLSRLDFGYGGLTLRKDGKKHPVKAHRLVAIAFIPNPKNRPFVNHLNCKTDDNRIENLEWCTPKENAIHAFAMGRKAVVGERNGNAKLTAKQVIKIRELFKQGKSMSAVARRFGVGETTVGSIKHGRLWKYLLPSVAPDEGKIYHDRNTCKSEECLCKKPGIVQSIGV